MKHSGEKVTERRMPERARHASVAPPVRRDLGGAGAILALQATAGNSAVGTVLQRAPAKHGAGAAAAGDAALLGMHLSMLLGPTGRAYGPADTAGLPDADVAFIRHVYQAVYDHKFGAPDQSVAAVDQEADLAAARGAMPGITRELALDPSSKGLADRLNRALASKSSNVTHNAMMVRALSNAELEARLHSREVSEARASVLAALQNGWKSYSKFAELAEATASVAAKSEKVGAVLKDVHAGLDTASKLAKALDPESYQKAVDEAREWCHEHGVGTGMGMVKAVQVEAEMVELTLGTLTKVVSNLSKVAIFAFGPKGSTIEMLEELAHAGELVGTGGKVALKLGKLVEKLEKFETALSAIAIAGGLAKLATADTNFERVDAGIEVTTGALQLAGKVTGRVGLGAAASSVLMTWEMVKFFGDMGLGAIEGSMYGGLYQELSEIQERGDKVGVALVSLARAVDERDARFGGTDVTSPDRAGADEACADLAYRLQKVLGPADHRWQDSRIRALANAYRAVVRQSVAVALQDGYPPELVAEAAIDFMRALGDAYRSAPEIVVDMLVDQGYMSPEKAEAQKKKMAKSRAGGAGGHE